MSHRIALVTGASRGIGQAIARHLAAQGYDLILLARDAGRLSALAETLQRAHSVTVHTRSVDVRHSDAVKAAVQPLLGHSGRLDVLVNAAGIFRYGTSAASDDDMLDMFRTNVLAAHNLCVLCGPALKDSGRAHVFNVASIAAVEGFAPIGAYSASKFALAGYGASLGKEWLSQGVRVTTLCPDVVDTDMAAGCGLPSEQMIATDDLCKAIDFVLGLSAAALVEQLVIKCKVMQELSNVRK